VGRKKLSLHRKTHEDLERTLRLAIIDQLAKLPNTINLVAVVVNHDNTVRGFLTPFMRSGDLESVFKKARQSIGLGDDDDATAFEWSLKLSWAHQIAQGVVELHAISAYNGDLKPQDVFIDPARSCSPTLLLQASESQMSSWHLNSWKCTIVTKSPLKVYYLPPKMDIYLNWLVSYQVTTSDLLLTVIDNLTPARCFAYHQVPPRVSSNYD
jgi:serine/threonine protein kinase